MSMKAAVITKFEAPIEVKEIPIPEIKPTEVLVKINYSGLCGTDHHVWKGDWDIKAQLPLTPGHEGVGEIVKIGRDVEHVKVGDLVGIPWLHDACGNCEYCFAGWETLCRNQHQSGFTFNGTLAQYAVADPKYVARIPDGVDQARVAPILCAGVTVYKALKVTDARAGHWVLISGLGGLGLLAVQYAKAMGFNVIGIDIEDDKLEEAKELGARYAFNSRTQDATKLVKEVTEEGVHATVVVAANIKAYSQALDCVRPNGTLVAVGLPAGSISLNVLNTVLNGVTVKGSIVGTRYDMIGALQFFAQGKIKNSVTLNTLDKINDSMQLMDKGKLLGRVVFDLTA